MILVKKAYQLFFFIGMFFLPFNSQIPDWFSFLGAYSDHSSSFFFLIGFVFIFVYFIGSGKIYLPLKSTDYSLFVLFLFVICLVSLINLPTILDYYFKHTSGPMRFLRQLLSVLLGGVVFFILFLNVCYDFGAVRFFLKIRRLFLISFILVFIIGMMEYLVVVQHMGFLERIVHFADYLPFVEINLDYRLQRLSAITFEPPALGTYLITVSGFLFSYILTSKKNLRFLPFLAVVLLAILSKSRMALVVIIFQVMIGVFFAYVKHAGFRNIFNKMAIIGTAFAFIFLIIFWTPVQKGVSEKLSSLDFTKVEYSSQNNSVSNKSRFGIQYAMWHVLKENPIFGVGWGQQAYEARFHYPKWATENNYEFSTMYLNEDILNFPPSYNMYLRVLTEAGIIGYLVFATFLCSILLSTLLLYRKNQYQFITITLFIAFGGTMLNWLQIDSFKLFGFWLCLAILIILKKEYSFENNQISEKFKPEI